MAQSLSGSNTSVENAVQADVVKTDIWGEALQALREEDRDQFEPQELSKHSHQDLLQQILRATNDKKQECQKKRWKFVLGGKTLVARDMLEKVSAWVNNFIKVGDVMMQYDPGHAALPWGAVRFFLLVGVNDVQIYGTMLQSIELISNILARCLVMEHLYLNRSFEIESRFYRALVELYSTILTTLAKILHYYNYRTAKRILKSIVTDPKDVEQAASTITQKLGQLSSLASLAEGEKSERAADALGDVKAEQRIAAQQRQEQDKKLLQLLDEAKQPIKRIDRLVSNIHDHLEMEQRAKILRAISMIPYPVHHKNAARDRLKGSGKWLLNESVYRDWRQNSSSSVVWVHGIPGSGKTKLASLVIDDVKDSTHLAFFYCMRNPAEPERAVCEKVFGSLVRQLASFSPKSPILEPVRTKYESAIDGFEGFDDQSWTTEESTEVLTELIDIYPSVTLVLDALDEVDQTDRLRLLTSLDHLMANCQSLVKIFITSRDSMDLVMHLESSPNLYISATQNKNDIDAFVNRRLDTANLLHGRLSSELREKIAQTLIDGAHGMFRWVDLQLQALSKLKVASDIESRLGHLPDTLEASYWEIYQQIRDSGDHAAMLATFTFQWLLAATSSISVEDFAALATVKFGTRYTRSEVLDVCAHLVMAEGATSFGFVHLSVREFIESLSKRQIHDFLSEESHAALAGSCLTYLADQFDEYVKSSQLDDPLGFGNRDDKEEAGLKRYALEHWPLHCSKTGDLRLKSPLGSQIEGFLFGVDGASPLFRIWCGIVRQDTMMSMIESQAIKEAAQLRSPNPVWIAIKYDLVPHNKLHIENGPMAAKALTYAAEKGDTDVLNILLKNKINLEAAGQNSITAAIRTGRADFVELLLVNGSPSGADNIYAAALWGHPEILELLLKRNADNLDETALSKALTTAGSNGDATSVAVLLKHGAMKEGVAVVRAIKNGILGAVSHLIDLDFDIQGSYLIENRTALHWAAEKGNHMIVSKLLEKGAQLQVKDEYEQTPLHLAARKGRVDVVVLLLGGGAQIGAKNIALRTPLHLAALFGHAACVKVLVSHGSDQQIKDIEGWNVLQLAQIHQHRAVVDALTSISSASMTQTEKERELVPFEVPTYWPSENIEAGSTEIIVTANPGSDSVGSSKLAVPALTLTLVAESEDDPNHGTVSWYKRWTGRKPATYEAEAPAPNSDK